MNVVMSSLKCLVLAALGAAQLMQPARAGSDQILEAKSAYDSGEYDMAMKLYKQELKAFGPVRDSAYSNILSRLGECY